MWIQGLPVKQAKLTMYHQYSQLSTSPCQQDQGVFDPIDAEVGEVGVIPQEQEVRQCFFVLMSDERQDAVGHQCAVTVQVEALEREAGLQDSEELRAVDLQGHEVHSQVGARTNLGRSRQT